MVVLRLIDQSITVQLIDGSQIQQPIFTSELHNKAEKRGNRIRHGVEIDKNDQHVAYYIRKTFNESTIVKAKAPVG